MTTNSVTTHPLSSTVEDYGDRQFMVTRHRNIQELLEDNTVDIEQLIDIATMLYTQGRCHIYAAAIIQTNPDYTLHISYRTAPDNEWEGRHFNPDETNIHHVYVINPENGKAYDAYGQHNTETDLLTFDGSNPENLYTIEASIDDIIKHIKNDELLPAGNASIELAYLLADKNINNIF